MEAVIKVGGSLAEEVSSLRKLCYELERLAKVHGIVVVPGGGRLADAVRELDDIYKLPVEVSHRMAILAMDQFGVFLSGVVSDGCCFYDIGEVKKHLEGCSLPIFLPSRLMLLEGALEPSWDVTSDAIAAYIGSRMYVKMLILAKDVDGIFLDDPKVMPDTKLLEEISATELFSWKRETCVDRYLPKILLESKMACYVVNGRHPERIHKILRGEKTVFTRIT